MAIIKCKMCGGDLALTEGQSVAECEYCGSRQTVPAADNEKKLNLFASANKLRTGCEFDRAMGVYDSIRAEFPDEAEAYWGLVLCKYGIEYVDDPATGKKIPTCHRSSFDSILEDTDFEQTLENADAVARRVYLEEGRHLEQIRKDILAVSSNEQPYDIFICYKETDSNGDRTVDSLLAQDIYDTLTAKGYRVFFSRITLEDKLGQAYEPYIFAALNSAKIMLAVGTCYEHYNAVWVKNEWSRFLKMMSRGEKKYLIPCYKNLDAYDMPREFQRLQAQDIGKVGAIADLLRGIEKLLPRQREPVVQTVGLEQTANSTSELLLKRVSLFLEDGDWKSADEYCEKVLDMDPENPRAYLGKLMAELKIKKQEQLKGCAQPFDGNKNYQKAIRFADDTLKASLQSDLNRIHSRIEGARIARAKRDEEARIAREKQEEEYRLAAERNRTRLQLIREKLQRAQGLVAAGANHTVGLKSDSTVVVTKYTGIQKFYSGECEVNQWEDVVALSANSSHTVGLKSDGTVVATKVVGDPMFKKGQCRVSGWTDIVAIAAGSDHTVGLRSDGTVVATTYIGDLSFYRGQCEVSAWKNIVAVAAGHGHTVGLKSDGTVVATKYIGNQIFYQGQCEVTSWKDIVAVAAGAEHTVGLRNDGSVIAVGDNNYGQCKVTGWKDIVAISAGNSHTVGLKSDGTVVATRYAGAQRDYRGQCEVTDWTDIVAIATGSAHTIGLRSDGTVVATRYIGDQEYYSGKCDVTHWKLFRDYKNLGQEHADHRIARAGKEAEMHQWRGAGLCQHCGGDLKGLFTKKCTICGKPKDY